MNLREAIIGRRTIHAFKKAKVDQTLFEEVINLARWAPNHHLKEPWKIYELDEQVKINLGDLVKEIRISANTNYQQAEKIKNSFAERPHLWVITSAKENIGPTDKENFAATCCFIQNLSLLLHEKGIGMHWSTGEITRSSSFYKLMDIDPEKEDVAGLLTIGIPAKQYVSIRKKSFENIYNLKQP